MSNVKRMHPGVLIGEPEFVGATFLTIDIIFERHVRRPRHLLQIIPVIIERSKISNWLVCSSLRRERVIFVSYVEARIDGPHLRRIVALERVVWHPIDTVRKMAVRCERPFEALATLNARADARAPAGANLKRRCVGDRAATIIFGLGKRHGALKRRLECLKAVKC